MIPKVIHYCWFGGKPLPKEYQRYIDSWHKYMPDYEIRRWDESNYDVRCIPFSSEAYDVGKYAYVSDYARLKILYEHGGVYFDTDVEVIRSLDDIMKNGAWMAVEKHKSAPDNPDMVAVGLGFAVEPGNKIIAEVMSYYERAHFVLPDGSVKQIPIVPIVTNILHKHGLPKKIDIPVSIEGITIYPWDYFCPQEFMERRIEVTEHTYTIHHFAATWMTWREKLLMKRGYYADKVRRALGIKIAANPYLDVSDEK